MPGGGNCSPSGLSKALGTGNLGNMLPDPIFDRAVDFAEIERRGESRRASALTR
jgi:hypothetical protein